MGIEQIVDIQISRQTTAVSRAGFGTMLFVGEHAAPADRIKFYTSTTEVGADYDPADPEYIAAQSYFSQEISAERIAIGKKETTETYVEALDAIQLENDDWYAITIEDRTKAIIVAVAAWTEAKRKLFFSCSDEAAVLTSAADDVASTLKAAAYDRTSYLWSADEAKFPECAWVGLQIPKDAGSSTWKFKTLAGITRDVLNATQQNYALGKNANIYITLGGVNITMDGKMASGEWIDIMHGVDWLQARLEERIYGALVNSEKIPYTDAGVSIIESQIRAQLREGIRKGLLAENPAPTVSVPLVADISSQDKINRYLPDVTFFAYLQGAIHKIAIRGVVTI